MLYLQEEFVNQTKAGTIFFQDGREFPGTHSRFVMEHKNSRKRNVSAGQMWDFVSAVSNGDLGIIHHYEKKKKHISKDDRSDSGSAF